MRLTIPVLLTGVAAVAFITVVGGSFYTVSPGERAVLTRFGAITGTDGPGLGFKTPFITSAHKISVQPVTIGETLNAYSSDQQLGDLKITVTYALRPDKVADLYANFTYEENYQSRIVKPRLQQDFKAVFGRYTAQDATAKRVELAADTKKAIEASINDYSIVESIQVENIKFSEAFDKALEERKAAEVAVLKAQQNALQAKIAAEIQVTKAKAAADSTRLQGDAEAAAIKARSDALKESPNLVALTAAEKWDGKLPTTMVPNGALPFVAVK